MSKHHYGHHKNRGWEFMTIYTFIRMPAFISSSLVVLYAVSQLDIAVELRFEKSLYSLSTPVEPQLQQTQVWNCSSVLTVTVVWGRKNTQLIDVCSHISYRAQATPCVEIRIWECASSEDAMDLCLSRNALTKFNTSKKQLLPPHWTVYITIFARKRWRCRLWLGQFLINTLE